MEEVGVSKGYGKRPMWQWAVIYLVIAAIVYGAFYYFFLAKKGGYNYNSPNQNNQTQTTAPTATSSAMMSEMTINLAAENKSGEAGTAVLKEENGVTTVTLDLTGFTADVSQPAHIHVGGCPGVGAVKYPLTNVINGKSVTVLSLTLDQLKQSLPLAINVHKSAKDIAIYTSCGELSSK